MSKAFYSLVQFSPDLGRQEAFNVGIAVFSPDSGDIDIRMVSGFGAHAPRNPELDLELFEATKKAFANRLRGDARRFRGAEDMAAFRASGTNPLRLTPPRQIVLREPAEDIQAAFDSLVQVPHASEKREAVTRGPRVRTRLRQAFASRRLDVLVERDVEAFVPAFGTRLKVPYAYRNGRYNLIEPVDFTMRDEAAREERTAWFAVGGRSIFDTPDPHHGDRKLVVVARLPADQAAAKRVSTILEDYSVDCIPFSDTGLDRLATAIRTHVATDPEASVSM
jgi:hypothetical protein